MKLSFTVSVLLIAVLFCKGQVSRNSLVNDFRSLEGNWKGSLTYLDYTSGKPYTMDANLRITPLSQNGNFSFSNIYPNEANANSVDTIVVSPDGKYIDKQLVKSRKELANGSIEIITEEFGKDGNDNKPAAFKHTYSFGKTTFSIKKEIQFIGDEGWIKRHEYVYRRGIEAIE